MAANPLQALTALGQSIWLDFISRNLLVTGGLKQLVEESAVTGVTSNPTIFEKAIAGSTDYDKAIRALVSTGSTVDDIYDALTIEDIQSAAGILRPVFDRTGGADGFVSLEVSPLKAHDTEETIAEARRLWKAVNRPNLMVKVPATVEGLPAIELLIADGININVTLLFAVERYEAVMDAYFKGLETRVALNQPIDRIASVASFFVSRIDTVADKLLQEKITAAGSTAETLKPLLGRTAIANAKEAYQSFLRLHSGDRFLNLVAKGARVQRPLWASTSTKNLAYPDVMYVEELIGPDTVDTMPPQTIDAYRDHGTPARTIDQDIDGARATLKALAAAGIDLNQITTQVEVEGVKLFAQSFASLHEALSVKRAQILGDFPARRTAGSGGAQAAILQALKDADAAKLGARVWAKDPAVWSQDPAVQAKIRDRLGWLTVPQVMKQQVGEITAFAAQVRKDGYTHAAVLGMGGSSLCPDVCRLTFGTSRDGLALTVIDTTDPATILAAAKALDPKKTLFIVSSKSGTTLEPDCLFRYFWALTEQAVGKDAGRHFIAITDPGTVLAQEAADKGFRKAFFNPPDIGGRYSALSYFGLVPAALIGVDIAALLDRAEEMALASSGLAPAAENPGVRLGAALGALAKMGLDKITFVCDPNIRSFGYWAEQLIAESTGKEGTGLVPLEGEALGAPDVYGNDRVFVHMTLEDGSAVGTHLEALAAAGHRVMTFTLRDTLDLGGEFFRWELATAVAGAALGINPFDEPNVQESKDNTNKILAGYTPGLPLPEPAAVVTQDGVSLAGAVSGSTLAEGLCRFLAQARPGDYGAILAYLQQTEDHTALLDSIRIFLRDALKVAVTVGYGPRFLHSTGQLHKGGPNTGLYLQITAGDAQDAAIPGKPFTFGTLKAAQALGDLQSLQAHGHRVVRVHLADAAKGLPRLVAAVADAVAGFTARKG